MRYILRPVCLIVSVLLTGAAVAEDGTPNDEDRAGRREEMRQKILEEFDADADGELNDEERSAAREEMRSRRGSRNKGDRAKGDRAKGDRKGKQRGKGRHGVGGPPDPAKVFDKFDTNGDGQLSREEFMKLAKEMRPPRPPRDAGKRGSARRDGPPPAGRRRFERDRPLQNPYDRSGPPRPEGRRRLYDEDGPNDRGRRGPDAHGHKGHRRPSPDAIFDHFDENSDDQLSRDEFMKLADRMRQMRERFGSRGGEHGLQDGRGPRRGPPGGDGPPRRRQQQQPESGTGAETPAIDDGNSV